MVEIKNSKLRRIVEKARCSFYEFCRVVTKDDNLEPFAKFQKLICDRIDDQLHLSPEGIREMFSVPPGYGKSTLLSQLLVAYLLGIDPKNKIMLISYGADLSKRNAVLSKIIMEKPIYKLIFPETLIAGERENPPFDTTMGGGIRAMGRGGSITGFRADFILIDDILKGPEEAASEAIIRGIQEWYPTVVNTRLKPKGGIIILATRWTKKDLIGWLSANSTRWNYINLEAICTDKEKDPIGREVGEALWPEYKSLESILEARELNERAFQVVYQGNCTASENTPIDIKRVKYTDTVPFSSGYTIFSFDTASKTQIEHDYTSLNIWKVDETLTKAVLIDIVRDKWEFPDLLDMYDDQLFLHDPDLIIIEDANSGIQLIQMRRDDRVLPSKTIKAEDKISIAEMFNIMLTDGDIKFLSWINNKKEELQEIDEFPFGTHDDVALSCLHFMKWFLDEDRAEYIVKRRNGIQMKEITKRLRKMRRKQMTGRMETQPFRGSFR